MYAQMYRGYRLVAGEEVDVYYGSEKVDTLPSLAAATQTIDGWVDNAR
jgi:hypothetical protein